MPKRIHYLESDMDETSRLILLDHKQYITADKFRVLFREQHPGVSLATVWFQWKKWHGTDLDRPTHDYVTGLPSINKDQR